MKTNEIKIDPLILKFVDNHYSSSSKDNFIMSTNNIINIKSISSLNFKNILNLEKSNSFRYTNKFFEAINTVLPKNGKYIGCVETIELRKIRLRKKYLPFIWRIYHFFDFIFTRIFPRLFFFKKIYFFITKGESKVISKSEVLGRLVSCGFEIIDFKIINLEYPLLYFIVQKKCKPLNNLKASYGPLFKMRRVGQNGEIIGVYKMRTMHPYSEYLQEYVLKKNGNSISGKILNDFRIPHWSRFLRKYWLDELPQILNVLKFEMNIFGPRPVSEIRFNQFPKTLQNRRIKYKPGCIPAYLAFNYNSDSNSLIKSEIKYLDMLEKYGSIINFFLMIIAIYNIVFKARRSS